MTVPASPSKRARNGQPVCTRELMDRAPCGGGRLEMSSQPRPPAGHQNGTANLPFPNRGRRPFSFRTRSGLKNRGVQRSSGILDCPLALGNLQLSTALRALDGVQSADGAPSGEPERHPRTVAPAPPPGPAERGVSLGSDPSIACPLGIFPRNHLNLQGFAQNVSSGSVAVGRSSTRSDRGSRRGRVPATA